MPTFYALRHGAYDPKRDDRGFVFDAFATFDECAAAWREHGGNMLQVDDVETLDQVAPHARYGWGWGGDKVGHLSIEGKWLPRALACPELLTFDDIFDRSEPWDHSTMNHRNGYLQEEGKRVESEYRTRHGFGVFCSIDLSQIDGPKFASRAVHVRPEIIDRVGIEPVDNHDRIGWSIIAHGKSGRALVIASHSIIIGSRYVAYIDPSTIPTADKATTK